jgi:hypothetical protein
MSLRTVGTGTRPSFALALALTLGWLVAVGVAAHAQEAPADSPTPAERATSLSVAFEPARMAGLPHYLVATLTADDGSAVVDGRVTFRRTADAFGGTTVTLGRATTDNAGTARIAIEPRALVYHITASYGGGDGLAASQVEDDIAFPAELVILPEHVPQSGLVDPQLRPLGDTMPLVIAAAVVAIWLVLIILALLTLGRIRSERQPRPVTLASGSAGEPDTESGSDRS